MPGGIDHVAVAVRDPRGWSQWMCDHLQFRILFDNNQFMRSLKLPSEVARPGNDCEDIIRFQAARGDFGPRPPFTFFTSSPAATAFPPDRQSPSPSS